MTGEIKRDGYLYLYADTETEAYALRKWAEYNAFGTTGPKIVTVTQLPHERKETEE